jgi:hypothetical protein
VSIESQNIQKIGVRTAVRHIFLCADASTPKCCDAARSLAAFEFLKKRLAELGLSDGGGILRTKANCLRVCENGPIASATRRCSSASSRSTSSAAASSPTT